MGRLKCICCKFKKQSSISKPDTLLLLQMVANTSNLAKEKQQSVSNYKILLPSPLHHQLHPSSVLSLNGYCVSTKLYANACCKLTFILLFLNLRN